jgi:hypothetical protein
VEHDGKHDGSGEGDERAMSVDGEGSRVARPVREVAAAVASTVLAPARRTARRIRLMAVLLRAVVWATGCAALLLAVPPSWAGRSAILLAAAVVAVVPAVAPASWPVLALPLVAAGGWLLRTWDTAIAWPPLMGLAAVLYLHHVSAAFAASLPGDAHVVAGVLRRQVARTTAVLVVIGILGALALALQERIDRASTVVIPVVGVVLAVAVAGYLALVWRRRGPP